MRPFENNYKRKECHEKRFIFLFSTWWAKTRRVHTSLTRIRYSNGVQSQSARAAGKTHRTGRADSKGVGNWSRYVSTWDKCGPRIWRRLVALTSGLNSAVRSPFGHALLCASFRYWFAQFHVLSFQLNLCLLPRCPTFNPLQQESPNVHCVQKCKMLTEVEESLHHQSSLHV